MSDDKRIEVLATELAGRPLDTVHPQWAARWRQQAMRNVAAIDAADAVQGVVRGRVDAEPVAWEAFCPLDGITGVFKYCDRDEAEQWAQPTGTVTPLYTHPPCPTEVSDVMVEAAQAAWGDCMCPDHTIHDTFRRMLQAALTAALSVR